jgi:hypothetical protein
MPEERVPKAAEFIGHYAELVRQKEEALGHPPEDGPSFQDMAYLYRAFEWLDTANDNQPPTEIHALMELIADVRDSWADPENDPIGRELFPVLSDVHHELGKVMDAAVPESSELRQKQENLRALSRAIKRNLANRPPSIFRRIKTAGKNLLGKNT